MTKSLVSQSHLFDGYVVRTVPHKNQLWFSIVDVIRAVKNPANPNTYWSSLKVRLAKEEGGFQLTSKSSMFKLRAEDGKLRETECMTEQDIYELLYEIPSKKTRKFKEFSAFLVKSYLGNRRPKQPKPQIPDSIKVPAIEQRKELTDVMKDCGKNGIQIVGLTNQIYRGALGADSKTIKAERGIDEKDNLRDHLSPQERLIVMKAEEVASNLLMDGFKEDGKVSSGAVGKIMREWCKTAREFFSSKPKLLT